MCYLILQTLQLNIHMKDPISQHLCFKLLPHLPLMQAKKPQSYHSHKFKAHLNPSSQQDQKHQMGKKMRFPSLFKSKETRPSSWQWTSCKHPKTQSFRACDDILKTVNSVYFDVVTTPESWFTNSSESASFSSVSEDSGGESVEMVIRGLRSERLFWKPGDTNSIMEEAKVGGLPLKESVMLVMESEDPFVDFRKSMEEMVEAHGLKDWGCLEELLGWYLRVNGKKNHGFILGAFVDLIFGIASSPSASSTSISLCSLEGVDDQEGMASCSEI